MNESDFKNQEVKNYLVTNFIEHNLLLQEAQRRNIKVDEKKISAVTESFLSEAGTQDLKVYSGSYDTDAKALSEILREKFMVETLISDMINSNIDIKEDEIKITINMNIGECKASAWGCDLTYDYVNAYTESPVRTSSERKGKYRCMFIGGEYDKFHFALYYGK